MPAKRKSSTPLGAFWIAQKGCRLAFANNGLTPYHNIRDIKVHGRASDAYYALAEMLFPLLDRRAYSTNALRQVGALFPDAIKEFYPRGLSATLHVSGSEQRRLMNELFVAIQEAIEKAHEEGIKRGKSLLIQLAKGKMTAKQFNDCAIEDQES